MERETNIDRKLIPLWQISVKWNTSIQLQACSDHGGVGVDLRPRKDENGQLFFDIITIKEQCNVFYLGSKTYSLPFLDPNKISKLQDPCLEEIDHEKKVQKNYFSSMHFSVKLGQHVNKKIFNNNVIKNLLNEISRDHVSTISLNKKILELARLHPDNPNIPRANWLYSGNCVSVTSQNVFLHPVGASLNQLGMTPLVEQKNNKSGMRHLVPGELQILKLKGGPIHQISFQEVMKRDLCLVRKKHVLHILALQSKDEEATAEASSICKFKTDKELCSASLSPHIPGEYASVSSDGHLRLHTFTNSDPIWKCHQPLSHSATNNKADNADLYWCCGFGSHPRSLLHLDRTRFTFADLRAKGITKELILRDPLILSPNEQLFLFQQNQSSYFQHFVASSHHLLVVDERFPKKPVQMWKHQLTSFPFYLSQCRHPSFQDSQIEDQFILLAGQRPQETVCFQIRPSGLQPISLAPPWYCSAPSDAFKIFELYGLSVPESIKKRTSFPLMGVCSIPHSKGITILQMTSTGDTFYQDFEHEGVLKESERTHRYGAGYVPMSTKREFESVQSWMTKAEMPAEESKVAANLEWCNLASLSETIFAKRPVSRNCAFCIPRESQLVLETTDCPSCGLSSETTKKILGAKLKGGLLVEGNPLEHDNFNLALLGNLKKAKKYDPFSEKLLEVWDIRKKPGVDEETDATEGDILRSYLIPESNTVEPNSSSNLRKRIVIEPGVIETKQSFLPLDETLHLPIKNISIANDTLKDIPIAKNSLKENYEDSFNMDSQDLFVMKSPVLPKIDACTGINFELRGADSVDSVRKVPICENVLESVKRPISAVHLSDSDDNKCISSTPVNQNDNNFTPIRHSFARMKKHRFDGF